MGHLPMFVGEGGAPYLAPRNGEHNSDNYGNDGRSLQFMGVRHQPIQFRVMKLNPYRILKALGWEYGRLGMRLVVTVGFPWHGARDSSKVLVIFGKTRRYQAQNLSAAKYATCSCNLQYSNNLKHLKIHNRNSIW